MKMLPTLTSIALAFGVAAPLMSPTPALADEPGFDANNDGMFDQNEWGAIGNEFSAWDADDNGVIDEDEWNEGANTAFGGEPGGGDDDGPVFGLLDTTDDNQIGEDEFFTDDNFGTLDDNGDGVLDENEFGV